MTAIQTERVSENDGGAASERTPSKQDQPPDFRGRDQDDGGERGSGRRAATNRSTEERYLRRQSWEGDLPVQVKAGNECKETVNAVVVFSTDKRAALGATLLVCPSPKCTKHGTRDTSRGSTGVKVSLKGLALVKHKEDNLTKSRPQRLRWAVFQDLCGRLLKSTDSVLIKPNTVAEIVARQALEHLYYDNIRDAAKALGYEKPNQKDNFGRTPWDGRLVEHFKGRPAALLVATVAAEDIRSDGNPKDSQLYDVASIYKVNVASLHDTLKKADAEFIGGEAGVRRNLP